MVLFFVFCVLCGCSADQYSNVQRYEYNEVHPETGIRKYVVNGTSWPFTSVNLDCEGVEMVPDGFLSSGAGPSVPPSRRLYLKFPPNLPIGMEIPCFVTAYDDGGMERSACFTFTIGDPRRVEFWVVTKSDFY
jgi:hypothetical protein